MEGEGEGVGERVGEGVGERVGEGEGEGVGERVGEGEGVGERVGEGEGVGEGVVSRWGDLTSDILVKVFDSLDIFDVTPAQVCSRWRLASSDPLRWNTLDLSHMQSNFIKTISAPYVYVDEQSDKALTRVLKGALILSRGSILTLIFNFNLYVSDQQLVYTAERCPQLKRLVMPAWNRIRRTGICKAICMCKDLESLTMPSIGSPSYVMEEIAKNCKNFSQLKVMGPFDSSFASAIVKYLPNLKVLSLRCSMLTNDALVVLLDGLKHLEVLNISHCLFAKAFVAPPRPIVLQELDKSVIEKASGLRQFLTCACDSCITCQRTRMDEGLLRWYKYEEGFWKVDEVQALAV